MKVHARLIGWMCVAVVGVSTAACGSGETNAKPPVSAGTGAAPAASSPAGGNASDTCPLTVEQVAAVTGAPMTLPPGGCTFFPANGRDVPHVFYVLQNPMVCGCIQPGELGFTETVDGIPGRAFVRDQIDGTHVLVCRENARVFDIVVDCAGHASGFELARKLLLPRGTLVLKSTFHGAQEMPFAPIVIDEISIVGSRCGPFAPASRRDRDRATAERGAGPSLRASAALPAA